MIKLTRWVALGVILTQLLSSTSAQNSTNTTQPNGCLWSQFKANNSCVNCKTCRSWEYRAKECFGSQDSQCQECSICASDQYMTQVCTVDADTVCNACSPCAAGRFEVSACSASANTECRKCWRCDQGTFEQQPCEGRANTQCAACSSCSIGRYEAEGCNEVSDTKCEVCSSCPEGKYQALACTETSDTVCADCSECPPGKRETSACSASVDTMCEDCSVCAEGEFKAEACSSDGDGECQQCGTCGEGQYEETGCSAVTDVVCSDCSECGAGYFQQSTCTATQDTKCVMCSNCQEGEEYLIASCTADSDTICQVCSKCGPFQRELSTCGAGKDAVCYDLPNNETSHDPSKRVVTLASAATGTQIFLTSGHGVMIPPGALAEDTIISVEKLAVDAVSFESATQSGIALVSDILEFSPPMQFLVPVTLVLEYRPPADNPMNQRISIHKYDESGARWLEVGGSTADQEVNKISAETGSFSIYAVFQVPQGSRVPDIINPKEGEIPRMVLPLFAIGILAAAAVAFVWSFFYVCLKQKLASHDYEREGSDITEQAEERELEAAEQHAQDQADWQEAHRLI